MMRDTMSGLVANPVVKSAFLFAMTAANATAVASQSSRAASFSGDDPIVYAIDLAGRDHGSFRLEGTRAVDWEDIALSRCPARVGPGDCLYIADTGDNEERRQSVAIYVVREPNPAEFPASGTAVANVAHVIKVRYLEGPQDVEALGVDRDGTLLLITKGGNHSSNVYWVQPSADGGTIAALASESLPIEQHQRLDRMVTAAAISPDGSLLAVRTYTELFFFRIHTDGSRLLHQLGPPCWIGMQQIQGESVDFLDHEWVVLTSEAVFGRPGTIAKARCESATVPK
ncbi:MAG: hypothetical protein P8X82_00845 [Gemmatimonadales bacterium]